ncbi:MAG: histidine phosphatase family protein [Mesorhizobium sp.]|uniref:histidine phosphatase family protein n=1 Tax=unclassified Mesorhizobium TaxID=325217 RepID=UPI000F754A76|nr:MULTISPECIES: histidine phosphatase family protein [unclassified Mesorhizobium]AZO67872.1 histidine phosphatase family protein [Mesorhizobium sp. M6A.T.Cr.TU.016.01.1.1]RWO98564.1 MAG: histidine phosphatase family protein [Mesorhizobium sp.]RWP49185.1 MAG: histidine phosphatase family protein [Mesorhizobium sp.]RWP52283.1 MAG: histidine phosphatase family protein [Mesorhizobium sp.]RWP73150.1 MAG: histidine phosphatase family protein [Mesorhizobium sp.]
MLRFVLALLLLVVPAAVHATEAGWALLRDGGHVVLLRHAMVTGTTDPASFDIEKCATQVNLSVRGKQQARKIGALFAARAAPIERMLSSRFCRSLDTARIAFRAEPEPFAPLDLLKTDPSEKAAQLEAVMTEIRNYSGSDNVVMVTHLENIMALTGISPREGEAVIVEPQGEGLRVLGRVTF